MLNLLSSYLEGTLNFHFYQKYLLSVLVDVVCMS